MYITYTLPQHIRALFMHYLYVTCMLPIHYWNARDGFSLLILLINTTVNTSEIKTQPGAG